MPHPPLSYPPHGPCAVPRFTSFLSGKAHVSAQEQVDYEWSEGAGLDSMSDSESDSVEHNDNTSMNVSHRYIQ